MIPTAELKKKVKDLTWLIKYLYILTGIKIKSSARHVLLVEGTLCLEI